MYSANYQGAGRVELAESNEPKPGPGEVRIAVSWVGLCGTDLHIFHGHMDERVTVDTPFGHEMSGTVAEVGEGVTGLTVGEAVTVMPLRWDGTCPACLAGNQHICQHLVFMGVDSPGALQQSWTVPAEVVIPLPEALDLRDAALTEPVAVAVHDVRRSEAGPGDKVVVIGAGPIGTLIAVVARDAGAEVLVIELDDNRRAQVTALGFSTVSPRDNAVDFVQQWTGGAGADIVFEVSGSAAGAASMTDYAKVRGTIVVVAIHPTPREVNLHRFFWRELRLLGARVYERTDFERSIELLSSGTIPSVEVITATYPLDSVGDALTALEGGKEMKVLVDVAGYGAES